MSEQLRPCGSTAAYQEHMLRGEQPCELCREAMREYNSESKKREREALLDELRRKKAASQMHELHRKSRASDGTD